MLLVDHRGLPRTVMTLPANIAEVNTIETLIDVRVIGKRLAQLFYDRAADADWLRVSLAH